MTVKALPLGPAIAAAVSLFAPVSAVAQETGAPPLAGPRVELTQASRVFLPGGDSGSTLHAVGRKSPFVAGALSLLVPGLGSFYAGNSGHGIRHLGIGVASVALAQTGTDCVPNPTGEGSDCSYTAVGAAAWGVFFANWIWGTVVAVKDAKARNRSAGGAQPGDAAGRLDVAPGLVDLSNRGASSRASRPVASAGLQLMRVEF